MPFTVNHVVMDQSYSFDINPLYQCNTNYFCLIHQNSAGSVPNPKDFSISQRLERWEIKDKPDYKTLLALAKDKSITLGDPIPTDQVRYDLLQLIWVYQDVRAIHLKDILSTDHIIHWIQLCEEIKIHNAKYKKLSQDHDSWLYFIIEEGMNTKMYKRTFTANGCPSK